MTWVMAFCCEPGVSGEVCAPLLASLDPESVNSVIRDPAFPLVRYCNHSKLMLAKAELS